MYRSLATA
ncbi:hypothetical protein LINGRAPRIM_LOCUS1981 [Linum grandiflorum]